MQRNPFLVVAFRDFNSKSSKWFCQDKNRFEGDAIENKISQFGLHQVIKEPTHILDTSYLICVRVHSSLDSNCHHQKVFAKFSLEVIYLPRYVREVWPYKDVNTELLINSIGKGPF